MTQYLNSEKWMEEFSKLKLSLIVRENVFGLFTRQQMHVKLYQCFFFFLLMGKLSCI